MNIFFLHWKPKKAARYHLDRHVVKMILETMQLLCTAILCCDDTVEDLPCKMTHKNHPSAIWVRMSIANWLWLRDLGTSLCKEYTRRYGKKHRYNDSFDTLPLPQLPDIPFTPPTQAMPENYKRDNSSVDETIKAYRAYYIEGKKHLHFFKTRHAWKTRTIPKFILHAFPEYKERI